MFKLCLRIKYLLNNFVYCVLCEYVHTHVNLKVRRAWEKVQRSDETPAGLDLNSSQKF